MLLKNWAVSSAFLVLAACGGNNPTPNPSPYPGRLDPIAGQWTDYGTGTGAGFIGRLPNPFAMPAQASGKSVNYVYTAPANMAVGKTMALDYTVAGNAMFGTVDGGTPTVRLFIWQQNDQGGSTFRWWCGGPALMLGDTLLSCKLDPTVWTDVNGQNDPGGFAAAIANPYAIGFTFGGMFAGHGVWTTSGSATFKVNSFTVQ